MRISRPSHITGPVNGGSYRSAFEGVEDDKLTQVENEVSLSAMVGLIKGKQATSIVDLAV